MSVQRVAIFGPESTGKTWLAESLARHFEEPWVPEFVRGFWESRQGKIEASDLAAIARGQIAAEDAAASRARRLVFCDTELLTNVLWADLLFPGACPPWVREEAERRSRAYALYLFCDTDVTFAPDPQRCFPDEAGRTMCRRLWRETLEERGLRYVAIRGSWPEREAAARGAVEGLLTA